MVAAVQTSVDLLEALGSARAIAHFLTAKGVTGTPGQARSCPVAHYLKSAHLVDILVFSRIYAGYEDGEPEEFSVPVMNTPYTVREFILKFDEGKFPELIGKGWIMTNVKEGD